MHQNRLPNPDQALKLIRQTGDPYPDAADFIHPLGNHTYRHPRKGILPVEVDDRVLPAIGTVHADSFIANALRERGATVNIGGGEALERRHARGDTFAMGVSGYTLPGKNYAVEIQGLQKLYEYLIQSGRKPDLVVDGGVRTGALGANAALADKYGIRTLGYIPLQGLSSMSPRDDMVVRGITYEDREEYVGGFPHKLLVAAGGGEGSRRESQRALKTGSAVLLLALKDYNHNESLELTYPKHRDLREAKEDGRFQICKRVEDIPAYVDLALAAVA